MPIYLFSALLHLYVGWRLLPALGPVAQGLLLLVLVASTLLVPLGLLARRHVRGPAADRLALVGLLFMGLFSSLFVLTVLREHPLAMQSTITEHASSARQHDDLTVVTLERCH